MTESKGLLIVIAAPGGAGKGTIIRKYLQKHDNAKLSVSCTTRAKRSDDTEGSYYYIESKSEFEKMIDNDEFLEYVEFCGNYYGTPKKFVLDNINQNNEVILEIDYIGALNVKQKFSQAILVFVLPPSAQELVNRLKKRGSDSSERIMQRLSKAKEEVKNAKYFDYLLINDEINDSIQNLESIINTEKNIKLCSKEEIQKALDCKIDLEENKNYINNFISQLSKIE